MKKYFGTDGIRGVAGEPPLDASTIFAIGLALGEDRAAHGRGAVVVAEDTRESSHEIAATLAAGVAEKGVEVVSAGVIPTPGVAYLARNGDFGAGVMISASHNPYQDNGIKVFDHSGYKLPDAEEAEVEAAIERYRAAEHRPKRLELRPDPALRQRYVEFLARYAGEGDFRRLHLVIDCGHGAASGLSRDLFARLGAPVVTCCDRPDGRNINRECGALHPAAMAAAVVAEGAAAGVALDGDADRAIFADARGRIVDGDRVLLIAARELLARGELQPACVVGTVMSNLGLELALRALGVELRRTAVGDKYVLEEMRRSGAILGGEQSGHIIFGRDATTGDGLLTALHVFGIMARRGLPLATLAAEMRPFPQVLLNVRVREKTPWEQLAGVRQAVREAEAHFGSRGRVLVRYSGTEPLARIMVEAESPAEVERHARAIAAAVSVAIGADGRE